MNKKGIIAVVVIIVLIIGGYMMWGKSSTVSNTTGEPVVSTPIPEGVTKDTYAPVTKDTVDTSLVTRLKSVSVSAAETGSRVALVNGKAQVSAEGTSLAITIGDIAATKTVGGVTYVVAPLTVVAGGSSTQYIVLFTDTNGSLVDQSYALVGAGAQTTGIRADEVTGGFVVTVSFKDAAGKTKSKILVVEDGVFNSAKEINL